MQQNSFTPDSNNQCSSFILENLKPLERPKIWTDNTWILFGIRPLIRTLELLTYLGDAEHTSDWDIFLTIHRRDGLPITTDSGHYIMEIQGNNLLIEDSEESDAPREDGGEDIYWTIPMTDIIKIEIHS